MGFYVHLIGISVMQFKLDKSKSLSVFSLVMINIIAVDSLRTLPIGAEYGFSLIFFYLLAALVFFIPVALVSAELATAWPKTGGIYIWVKEAFGQTMGFMVIWMQWVYNIVWYPTILAFITSAFAYLITPELASNKLYLYSTVLILFWVTTLVNLFGMRVSSFVSIIGALFGTLMPMFIIICLAVYWSFMGYPMAIDISTNTFFPHSMTLSSFVLLTGVLFGLVGMEMSAIHAGDVKSPQRDYPRALLFSTLIIFLSLVLGSLSVAIVVPQEKLSLVTGVIDAFVLFFTALNMKWMISIVVVMMIFGGLSSVSAWIIGPSKGLMIAAKEGSLPAFFFKLNKQGAPVTILLSQAIIFSLLSSVFIFSESINASYWMLSALTEQLAMGVYILMFLAAIILRVKQPNIPRAFKVPGGNICLFFLAGMGILVCILALLIGFIPPSHIEVINIKHYDAFLVFGWGVLVFLPGLYALNRNKKRT